MANFSSEREQWLSSSCNNNTMDVDNMIYGENHGSSHAHIDECLQTAESYIGDVSQLMGNTTNLISTDSNQRRGGNKFVQLQGGTEASGSSYIDQSQGKRDDYKENKVSLQDSSSKNNHRVKSVKSCNETSNNQYRQKAVNNFNRHCISNSNKQHPINSSSSDKDYCSSKSHRRSSTSYNNLPCGNISSNSSSSIRPKSLHIPQSPSNKSQQKTTLHSPSQSHSELPQHCSRSRKKSVTHRDHSSTRRSLAGQHPTLYLPHHQLPTRSKSANPSTRCNNSARSRKKSSAETSQPSSSRLQAESYNTGPNSNSKTQCSASGYELSDSININGYTAINKSNNQNIYEHELSHNHISTSSITLSNPKVDILDSKLHSNSHTQSNSTIYPYEIAEGAQATAGSSRSHSLSKEGSTCSQSDVPLPGPSSSQPDTLQLGSWGNIAPQCLTRVSPTTPPRAPTPPRCTLSPNQHRQSVSPNLHRRSISPHLHAQPVSPLLPNSRRSMSPPPLPNNALGHPPSPTLRQRLSPRPRCARTPSPRPPLPPSSAPVEQSPPPHRTPASPHAHLNKMRGR